MDAETCAFEYLRDCVSGVAPNKKTAVKALLKRTEKMNEVERGEELMKWFMEELSAEIKKTKNPIAKIALANVRIAWTGEIKTYYNDINELFEVATQKFMN